MSALASNPQILARQVYGNRGQQLCCKSSFSRWKNCGNFSVYEGKVWRCKKTVKRDWRVKALWWNLSRPSSIEMESIDDVDQFDGALSRAQQISQPIIIDWMASWCRKCIYLKPKLEKLAADYDTKVKFYCVDVNKVPQALVKRGNISKMPTIQLWKDGEMKAEVIGGHKGWLVIEEVKEMISKYA